MNVWRRFQQLANPPSLTTIGTVVDADFGECTVEFPGGSRQRVQGAGTVGQAYFIQGGRLNGAAALPTATVIEV
jgi:hypothetical protein